MTHQGHAKFGSAPSVCEGHKEHDICACDGGLVSQSLPPVIALTGWTAAFRHGQDTHMLNTVLSILLSLAYAKRMNQWKWFNGVHSGHGMELCLI